MISVQDTSSYTAWITASLVVSAGCLPLVTWADDTIKIDTIPFQVEIADIDILLSQQGIKLFGRLGVRTLFSFCRIGIPNKRGFSIGAGLGKGRKSQPHTK